MLLRDVVFHESKNSKPRIKLKWIFLPLIFIAAGFLIYYYRLQIWLYFVPKEDTELLERIKTAKQAIREQARGNLAIEQIRQSKEVTDALKFLHAYEKAHPAEPLVYALRGILEYEFFLIPIAHEPGFYDDLLFLVFIDRYQFLPELDFSLWQRAILLFRKSLAFTLPEDLELEVKKALANLYLWGGKSYWPEAYQLIKDQQQDILEDLLNIILLEKLPRFEQLATVFRKESVELWKALYYLGSGNLPVGFSQLFRLTELPETDAIRNNALYLLAYLHKKQNLMRQELHYLKKIHLETFQKRFPWFREEFANLLRFFGEYEKAKNVLAETANL